MASSIDRGGSDQRSRPSPGVSRRAVLTGAAGAGALAATGGVFGAAGAAAAQTSSRGGSDSAGTDQVVAHVRDVRSGLVDVYVGERLVSVRDRELASRLARAAR